MGSRAWMLAALALPWFLHAVVVAASLLGARPLAGRVLPSAIVACGLAATLAVTWRYRERRELRQRGAWDGPARGAQRQIERVLFALWASGLGVSIAGLLFACLLPIVAYDALWYRVPVIAQWLDAGRIAWVVSDDPYRNGYPLGQEAVSAVVAAASGSLRFADATSFTYLLGGAFSLVHLCEVCGVRRAIARAAAALFLLAPMTILNASSGYVDAAFAGATVALLCNAALLSNSSSRERGIALATGMSAAHVLALKGTGLVFVGVVFVTMACRIALVRRSFVAALHVLALAGLLALPGAFFVIRDAVHTGNPLWPVEVRVAGHTLLRGVGTIDEVLDVKSNTPAELVPLSPPMRVLRNWLQLHGPARVFDDRAAGLGWAWPLFALPAIFASIVRAGRRRGVPPAASFVVAATFACCALQPMAWWARYTLWLWGAGGLALALEAERWAARSHHARLMFASVVLGILCLGEAAVAAAHANGAALAVQRWLKADHEAGGLAVLSDPRRALNAQYWPAAEFFELGLERRSDVCRGAFKPESDDAIVDGVLVQFNPRPRVHVIADDDGDWRRVRSAWREAGCSELLLLRGSPALAGASTDASVTIESVRAFDPLYVVRASEVVMRASELSLHAAAR